MDWLTYWEGILSLEWPILEISSNYYIWSLGPSIRFTSPRSSCKGWLGHTQTLVIWSFKTNLPLWGKTGGLNGPVSIVSLFDENRCVGKAHMSEPLSFLENLHEKFYTITILYNFIQLYKILHRLSIYTSMKHSLPQTSFNKCLCFTL
jgi:hypothetical protein